MPSPPSSSSSSPGAEGATVDIGRLKRLNEQLKEKVNSITEGRKKRRRDTSTLWLGRGIKKLASLFDDVQAVVTDNDLYLDYLDREEGDSDPYFKTMTAEEVVNTKQQWKRSHEAFRIIAQMVPNFQNFIDTAEPAELRVFYDELDKGASDTRGDDIKRLKEAVANWLNQAYPNHSPLLDPTCRLNRGVQHDTTGRLLCPIEFNWDDAAVRHKLRSLCVDDGYDMLSSYFCRCFYANYDGDPSDVEKGFLKSPLLLKAYRHIFTSPLSAENLSMTTPPPKDNPGHSSRRPTLQSRRRTNRKSIAHILNMNNRVTPRSIAYTCTQLHFSLMNTESWTLSHLGFDYKELYNFVITFFEDTDNEHERARADALLRWWTRQIFPNSAPAVARSAANRSLQKLKSQCQAALAAQGQ